MLGVMQYSATGGRERAQWQSDSVIYERKEGIYATFEWFHVQEVVAVHFRSR